MTLEDCARNVPKRISRLENFLRKRLSPVELNDVRYYEVCVVESKGALLVRFVILTSNSILLTENPPKSLLQVIRLSQIQDVNLVADRGSLVRGSEGNKPFICQHVRLIFEEVNPDASGSKLGKDEGHVNIGSWSSSSSSDESVSSRLDSVTEIAPDFDDEGSSDIPGFLRRYYDPFLDPPSNIGFISSPLNSLEKKHELMIIDKDVCDDVKSLESVSTSTSYDNGDELELCSTNNGNNNKAGLSPVENSLEQERQASPWSSDSGIASGGESKESEVRPESVDSELSANSRRSILSRYFPRRANSSKTIKSSNPPQPPPERPTKLFKDEGITFKVNELNLYLYQKESSLLNELHLSWNRSKVMYGLQQEVTIMSSSSLPSSLGVEEQSSRGMEKEQLEYIIEDKLLTDPTNFHRFPQLLPLLIDLQHQLESHQHLRMLCWKKPGLTGNLGKILQSCVSPEEEEAGSEDEDQSTEEERFIKRVLTFSILMDIFRLLFQTFGTSVWGQTMEKRRSRSSTQSPHLNPTTTARNLIHLLFSYPIAAMKMPGRIKILRVIFDPQAYAKLDWTNSAESKVIKVLTIAHNASVAVLHEILSLVYFSPREHEKITFMALFRKYSLEPYAKQSVSQIINLLWPSRRALRANQCSLLYRHVYVLKILLENSASMRTFVRISFCEEFQYFIHWNCIAMKVSNRFPIKPKLLQVFEELRQDIIQKEE